ncbi:MAG: hypothetical protein WBX22_21560, partial [Silvibacterium sp.]
TFPESFPERLPASFPSAAQAPHGACGAFRGRGHGFAVLSLQQDDQLVEFVHVELDMAQVTVEAARQPGKVRLNRPTEASLGTNQLRGRHMKHIPIFML